MSLKRNLLANYLGQGWVSLMGLAFVPIYIRYLGMEAYGLIGLFAVLQVWLTLLDMGMTPTLNREVARYTAGARSAESIGDLMRTFEVTCAGLALAITITVAAAAELIASDWLKVERLPVDVVADALVLMGVVAALRFVEGLYRGAILGLQRHVWLNAVTSALATLRAIGAVGVLAWGQASILAFFWWQAVISALTLLVFYIGVHRSLPSRSRPARFSRDVLKDVSGFAGGMLATTVLTLMVTQIDKVLLSRLLSLPEFGTYTFAAAVAGVLFQLIGPVAQVYFPRLTELVAARDEAALGVAYHQGAQLMSVVLVPAGFVLIAFGEPLLQIWTGNPTLAHEASVIAGVLALGTIFNGWMHIPYMLQLAYGWSSFAAWMNLVAAAILVPALFWVTPRYGSVGAAWIWVVVNAGYIVGAIHFMHVRLLVREKLLWYWHDLAVPTACTAFVVLASAFFQPSALGVLGDLTWITGTTLTAYVAAALGASCFRNRLIQFCMRRTHLSASEP